METSDREPVKPALWDSDDCRLWLDTLGRYPEVIVAQGNERLSRLDKWYLEELPGLISAREEPHVTLEELKSVTEWKMARGVWRERNRWLVAQNPPEEVIEASRKAFAAAPDPAKPVSTLAELKGVGPATASAVLAAYAPETYPFFDELVGMQIPGLGPVAFTAKYYREYADAIRERASRLSKECGRQWTPQDLSQALWAASGGKAQVG